MAFHGRVALVTGAGSGMGRICAQRLAACGAQVAAIDINEVGLEETARSSTNLHPYPCDVTDIDRLREIVTGFESEFGALDRVTHAAAIMPSSRVVDADPEVIKRTMRVNYDGTVNIVAVTMPKMIRLDRGDFICFGSVAGYALAPHLGAYSASKAAVNALIETLIWENRESSVRIHLTCPPMVDTPLIRQAQETSDIRSIQHGLDRKLAADPNDIVDKIEKALEKRAPISFPGAMAKGLYGMRRVAPSLLWSIILRTENAA